MSESLLQRILKYVEWSKPTLHVTGKGKSKLICTGTPHKHFWKCWKLHKEELKQAGISLRFYGEGKRKQWEVIAWRPAILKH